RPPRVRPEPCGAARRARSSRGDGRSPGRPPVLFHRPVVPPPLSEGGPAPPRRIPHDSRHHGASGTGRGRPARLRVHHADHVTQTRPRPSGRHPHGAAGEGLGHREGGPRQHRPHPGGAPPARRLARRRGTDPDAFRRGPDHRRTPGRPGPAPGRRGAGQDRPAELPPRPGPRDRTGGGRQGEGRGGGEQGRADAPRRTGGSARPRPRTALRRRGSRTPPRASTPSRAPGGACPSTSTRTRGRSGPA
ncbi:hypothetical protein GA0115239_12427, partial [Streptomyces sp. BpilaLS-43]